MVSAEEKASRRDLEKKEIEKRLNEVNRLEESGKEFSYEERKTITQMKNRLAEIKQKEKLGFQHIEGIGNRYEEMIRNEMRKQGVQTQRQADRHIKQRLQSEKNFINTKIHQNLERHYLKGYMKEQAGGAKPKFFARINKESLRAARAKIAAEEREAKAKEEEAEAEEKKAGVWEKVKGAASYRIDAREAAGKVKEKAGS